MADNYSLEIITRLKDYFSPEVPKLTESFNTISKNTKKVESDILGFNKAFEGIGKSWKSALSGMAVATAGFLAADKLKDFFTDIVHAANEKQQAIAGLSNTLDEYNKELVLQAEELEKTTLYSNESTIGAQNMLATYIRNADQLKILTPLVQDFAAKTGQDLNNAARVVTQSFAGTAQSFGRFKANIQGAAGSNERFNSIVKNMKDLFGGSAQVMAQVGTGPLQVMQNRLNSIKDDIGEQLLPYLKQFAEYVLSNIEGIKKLADTIVKTSMVIIQLGKSIYHFGESAINGFKALIEFVMGSVTTTIADTYSIVLKTTDFIINTFNSARSIITGTKYAHSDLANTMGGEYSYLRLLAKEFWNSNIQSAGNASKAFDQSIQDLVDIQKIFWKQQEFRPTIKGGKGRPDFYDPDAEAKRKAEAERIKKMYEDSLKRLNEMLPEASRIHGELLYGQEYNQLEKLDADHRMVMQQLQLQLDDQLVLAKNNAELKLQLQKEYLQKEQVENDKYQIKYNAMMDEMAEKAKDKADKDLLLQKEQGIASSKELLSGIVAFTAANEKYKTLYKTTAIAETLIATYSGATKAAASVAVMPFTGWSMAPFVAAGHIALGLANVARIAGIKMAQGGIVPGTSYSGDKVPAMLNSGELVMNQQMQANTLAAIGYGQKPYTNNNSNVNLSISIDNSTSSSSGVSLDNLADAMIELHRTKKLDKFLYRIGVKN